MQIGITGKQTITVTEEKTAQAMGSGTLPVFATPAMIALMENTASKSVEAKLDEGAGTVRNVNQCEACGSHTGRHGTLPARQSWLRWTESALYLR